MKGLILDLAPHVYLLKLDWKAVFQIPQIQNNTYLLQHILGASEHPRKARKYKIIRIDPSEICPPDIGPIHAIWALCKLGLLSRTELLRRLHLINAADSASRLCLWLQIWFHLRIFPFKWLVGFVFHRI